MTQHPARPAGYRPTIDVADLRDELADIDTLTADLFGPDVPLRDRVATLVADWQDTTTVLTATTHAWGDAVRRQEQRRIIRRRGLA